MAEEFVLKTQIDVEKKLQGVQTIQEKITFVKMEYFLYALAHAHHLAKSMDNYEGLIKELIAQIKEVHQHELNLGKKLAQASMDFSRSNYQLLEKAKKQMKDEGKQLKSQISEIEDEIQQARFKMAQVEHEFFLVLRELFEYDIHAPDHYFDGDRLLKQKRFEENKDDEFTVPLKTFWRPVVMEETIVDPNSKLAREKFVLQPDIIRDRPITQGNFLAPVIKDDLNHLMDAQEREKQKKGGVSQIQKDASKTYQGHVNLRKVEPQKYSGKELIAFKKLTNPSFAREAHDLNELSRHLTSKIRPATTPQYNEGVEAFSDPFGHLLNKEKMDSQIE